MAVDSINCQSPPFTTNIFISIYHSILPLAMNDILIFVRKMPEVYISEFHFQIIILIKSKIIPHSEALGLYYIQRIQTTFEVLIFFFSLNFYFYCQMKTTFTFTPEIHSNFHYSHLSSSVNLAFCDFFSYFSILFFTGLGGPAYSLPLTCLLCFLANLMLRRNLGSTCNKIEQLYEIKLNILHLVNIIFKAGGNNGLCYVQIIST